MPEINTKSAESSIKYCVSCLTCGKIIEEYDVPMPNIPMICGECRKAIAFAKWLKQYGLKEPVHCRDCGLRYSTACPRDPLKPTNDDGFCSEGIRSSTIEGDPLSGYTIDGEPLSKFINRVKGEKT